MIDPGAHDAPTPPGEKRFGLFFALLALGAGAYRYVKHGDHALGIGLAVLALVFAVLALAAPHALAPLNRAWFKLGLLLARVVNPIVLTVLFFVVITPYALVLRLAGRDALRLRPRKKDDADTYWIERDPPGPEPGFLERQY